jgi:hypothetical protein
MEIVEFEALSIVWIVLNLSIFVGALALGIKARERWNKWIGWTLGLSSLIALLLFFSPVIDLLQDRMCKMRPLMEDCY